MLSLLPQDFGHLLGLEQGLDGKAADILTYDSFKEIGADKLDELTTDHNEESWNFWQITASLYLPSLLRTFLRDPVRQNQDGYMFAEWYAAWVRRALRTPAFIRLCRLHPDITRGFLVAFIDLFASLDIVFLFLMKGSGIGISRLLTVFVDCFQHLLTAPVMCASAHHHDKPQGSDRIFDLPIVSEKTYARLAALRPLVEIELPEEAQEQHVTFYRDFLSRARTGGKLGVSPQRNDELDVYESWWNCEARRGVGRHATGDRGSCVVMEWGSQEQMLMCSRCQSVRYCCKAHQKADWKRHKVVCVKPSW